MPTTLTKSIIEQAIYPPDEVLCGDKPVNFKEKFKRAGKWIGKKGLKVSEETFYSFLAQLAITFFKLPPH